MLSLLFKDTSSIIQVLGMIFAFFATFIFTSKLSDYLPKDLGRDFAVNGKQSAGKPRGAGIIFILVFAVTTVLFAPMNFEIAIYLIAIIAGMMTGYLDDASKAPWGEYKKGLLDFIIAIIIAIAFLYYNVNSVELLIFGTEFILNPIVYGILIVILVWTAINVTNCSDGVDGLSGTLTIITITSIYIINVIKGNNDEFNYLIIIFGLCILAYLWFNAAPSKLMMGDAGSRAMGLFISIAVLKTGSPIIYLLVSLVLVLDGGLGLLKVALLRFLKIHIFKDVRLPLHDHVRKVKQWSNTQTVFRFAIIQIFVSIITIYLVYIMR